jgi:hypothetical protein
MGRVTRLATLSFALLAAAFFVASASSGALAQELPLRKAGLWELATVMDEGRGPRDQKLNMCIDDAMERTTAAASLAEHKANCARYDIKQEGGTTVVDADCAFGSSVQSRTEMSGDFKTSFQVKIESTTINSNSQGQSVPVKRTITQTGTYLGESCGDLQPGEAMGPDGAKVAVQ